MVGTFSPSKHLLLSCWPRAQIGLFYPFFCQSLRFIGETKGNESCCRGRNDVIKNQDNLKSVVWLIMPREIKRTGAQMSTFSQYQSYSFLAIYLFRNGGGKVLRTSIAKQGAQVLVNIESYYPVLSITVSGYINIWPFLESHFLELGLLI